jgi:hypothetical protein
MPHSNKKVPRGMDIDTRDPRASSFAWAGGARPAMGDNRKGAVSSNGRSMLGNSLDEA